MKAQYIIKMRDKMNIEGRARPARHIFFPPVPSRAELPAAARIRIQILSRSSSIGPSVSRSVRYVYFSFPFSFIRRAGIACVRRLRFAATAFTSATLHVRIFRTL